jgi:hypothetical protein
MFREFVVLSNRGTRQIDWRHNEAIRILIRERQTKGKTFAQISKNSIELFSIPVGASALTKAYRRHVLGKGTSRKIGGVSVEVPPVMVYLFTNHPETLRGATIDMGETKIILSP